MDKGDRVYEVGDEMHIGTIWELRAGKAWVQWSSVYWTWVPLHRLRHFNETPEMAEL